LGICGRSFAAFSTIPSFRSLFELFFAANFFASSSLPLALATSSCSVVVITPFVVVAAFSANIFSYSALTLALASLTLVPISLSCYAFVLFKLFLTLRPIISCAVLLLDLLYQSRLRGRRFGLIIC
jgi:hypothetical protein